MSTTEDRVARAVREVFEFGATQPSQFSPADIRRHRSRRWPHRAVVVAVAAAILVVFFVPLPHASLFKRLVSSARPSTATSLPTTVPSTATSVPTTVTSTTVGLSVKVPSNGVVDQSVSSARDALMAAGFKVSIYTRLFFSNTVPANFVITTYPKPGSRAPRGAPVFLVVSKGPFAIVPNVVLRRQAVAESIVTAANLTPAISFVTTPGFMPGNVVSQAPIAGTEVPPGSVVTIDVEQSSASTTTTSSA